MLIRDVMTKNPVSVEANASLQSAAASMAKEDVGSLPVVDGGKIAGVITDRDIVVRALAKGIGANGKVADAMTKGAVTCAPDDDIENAANVMGEQQIRRLYVVENSALVGVVALGDLATETQGDDAGEALKEISQE